MKSTKIFNLTVVNFIVLGLFYLNIYPCNANEVTLEQIKTRLIHYKATGEGIYPEDPSMNQTMKEKIAKRLATVDAYRILAEQIEGIKIDAETNMKDFMLQNDEVNTKVFTTIKDAKIIEVRKKQNLVEVDIEVYLGKDFYESIKTHIH